MLPQHHAAASHSERTQLEVLGLIPLVTQLHMYVVIPWYTGKVTDNKENEKYARN